MDLLTRFGVDPRTRLRAHEHPSVHVCVVLDGGFLEREGRAWRDVGAGTVRVSGAARHDIDFGPTGARCLLLETEPGTGAALAGLARPRFLSADGWLANVIHRIDAAASRPDPAQAVVLDGLSAELLAQLGRRLDDRPAPPPPWLARVRELLEDLRGGVTVSALAREAGVHRVHLARQFREHFGVPVTEYARRLRLETAQRMLVTTTVSLAQVAAHAGYADRSHLTRAMRAALGTTPGGVRRSALHRFKTGEGSRR